MKKILLEDSCEILDSRRIPITAAKRQEGSYPYYGANGIQGYVADYIFDDELVLLAEDGGNFGSKTKPIAYKVSGKCWVNNHAHVLKPKKGLNVDFLCYSLMFYNVDGLVNGATRQKLTQAAMRKMLLPDMSLDNQIKIVNQLNKVIAMRNLRKQELQKFDDLIKARFVEMFGNVPEEEKVTMAEICKVITDGTHQPPEFTNTGIPFLLVSNIVTNEICYDTEKFISEETYNELIKRTPIEVGDILLSTVGSYGHPAIVKIDRRFCFQRHIAYLKPKLDIVDSEYLRGAILSDNVQSQIDERVRGIAQKTLNLSEIRKIRLPLPPMELQNQYAEFVAQIDKSKVAVQKSLDKTQQLFDSLMQKYFG